MQKTIAFLCPGAVFTSFSVGVFPLRLRGAWKSRVKSYGEYRNWVQDKKRFKIGFECNEKIS